MPFDIDARIDEWKKSLLDTTKRNRLVKFSTGRGGGVAFLHPPAKILWQHLVVENRPLIFPWKREILGIPAVEVDGDQIPTTETSDTSEGAQKPGRGRKSAKVTSGLYTDKVEHADSTRALPNAKPAASSTTFPATVVDDSAVDSESFSAPRFKTIQELTDKCRSSPRLKTDDLLTEFSDKKLAAHLLRLSRTASESETEHGVSTLYAAFGFLRWYESQDSQEEIRSPLVLIPVNLKRESIESVWTIRANDDDPATNHCLAELLANDFRLKLPTGPEAVIDSDAPDGLASYLANVAKLVKSMPRWEVVEEAALGVFNFQKLAMWEDLGKNANLVKGHALCRAIAGDSGVELRPSTGLIAAVDLDDKIPPDTVSHILDADSSQHEAIEAVKRGANVVIDGPPGTGKSQTIANAIAELLGAGKTVLFVSEKTAALEVVKRRLDNRGLGDFCLELHSNKANKREVAAELGRCLDLGREAYRDVSSDLRQLSDDRRRLNAYVAELHRPRPPLNMTAFQVHGELARLANLTDNSRWLTRDVFALDGEFLRRATETLAGLTKCRAVFENPSAHPWRGCRLSAVTQSGLDDARYHLGLVAAGANRLAQGTTLADLALESPVSTVGQWREALKFAHSVIDVPAVPTKWFTSDPFAAATIVQALHAATTRARHLNGSLGAFSSDAVRELTTETAAEIGRGLTGHHEFLAGGRALSVRDRIGPLKGLADCLAKLGAVLARQAGAFDRLQSALRISQRVAPIAQARKFARVAAELASQNPLCLSWWDAARRTEIQSVVAKAAEEEDAAMVLRNRLATKFLPVAFAPEADPVVRDAFLKCGSFWRRQFPHWGVLKAQVTAWYAGPVPDRAGLLDDLGALSEFHLRASYVRHIEDEYLSDAVTTSLGRSDWAATAVGLKAVERYEKWKLPADLKTALAPNGGLDRASLASAADDLLLSDGSFQTEWADLRTVYAPADFASMLDRSAEDLASRLRADKEAAQTEARALERLISLLRAGHDLPPGTWEARSKELTELVGLRTQIARYASELGLESQGRSIEETDWSSLAATATSLCAFLNQTTRNPSSATIAALCDEQVRDRLRLAVGESDRALQSGIAKSWAYIAGELFPPNEPVSDGRELSKTSLPELAQWTLSRLNDLDRLEEWVRYGHVRQAATDLGIEAVIEEAACGRVGLDRAADAFRRRFFGLWLDALYQHTPVLARFAADDHDGLVDRFVRLDKLAVSTAPARLRSCLLAHPNRPHADGNAPASSELGIILREANKKRKHLPLRRLFAEVPTVLPRLKPCLMMSPLAVSTYLNSSPLTFDAVIFDEASQVRPHDAICAMYRGRQLVVAGDPRQLPPSDFFARSAADDPDAEGDEDGTAGFESLLDVCLSLGLVRKRLRWHYRSKREGLIAFSNKFFYDGGLVTFPSPDDGTDPAVKFERVSNGLFEDGVNVLEAKRTAELVVAHFRTSPAASLGVIAFSQRQQNRILDEVEAKRRANPDLEQFFKEDRAERFFVKNLENVQGDERDVIILSVGYGPDAAGKVAMRFGPLNLQGGERRLNVAVTRARTGMTVVASMTAADIDLSRTKADGAVKLRAFLDYAERGPKALTEAITGADADGFDSPFEREVFEELQRRGHTLHKQVGCSGFKVDMAVVDSAAGGRYLLGVECDGATYHSSATARDRDRLRQEVLEGLGWRLCRIWSTDWLRNREKQVRRVQDALDATKRSPVTPIEEVKVPLTEPASLPVPAATVLPTAPSYSGIEDVPEMAIRTIALALVAECGATEFDDLCVSITRKLGFKRMGAKIKSRIGGSLTALTLEKKLERQDDGRLKAVSSVGG